LNEELKEWKIETIESYYKFGEPSYPDIPSLTPEQVCADDVDISYCDGLDLIDGALTSNLITNCSTPVTRSVQV
jgi:hypothetical protein